MTLKKAEIELKVDFESKGDQGPNQFENRMRLLRDVHKVPLTWNRVGLQNNDTQFVIRVTGSGDRVQAVMLEVFKLTTQTQPTTA